MIDAFNTFRPALNEIGMHMSNGISLNELGALSALTFATCYFASDWNVKAKYIASTITGLALNMCWRGIESFISQIRLDSSDNFISTLVTIETILCLFLKLCFVSNHISKTGRLLIHEIGHAAASVLTFQDAKPKILLTGNGGGKTSYSSKTGLTSFGKFIGEKNAQTFVTAAGALTSVALANFGLFSVINFPIQNSYLRMSILASSIITITSEMGYALSPLFTKENNLSRDHDFNKLWKTRGIHPLVSAVSLFSLSIIPTLAVILK